METTVPPDPVDNVHKNDPYFDLAMVVDGMPLDEYCRQYCTSDQMTLQEYVNIASIIYRRRPCYVLVYGVGNDSELYINTNQGGVTVFVETDLSWIHHTKDRLPHANIVHHTFPTTVQDSIDNQCTTPHETPAYIHFHPWDVIVVDAPFGGILSAPGREFSIKEAANHLSQSTKYVDVFVHDVNRPLEIMACDKFFPHPPKHAYDRTRHYANYH